VGNISGEDGKKLAQSYFGGWKAPAGEKPVSAMKAPPTPKGESKVYIFDVPDRTQTQMYTSCRLNYAGPEEDVAVDVLSSLIRNRTFSQLRVKEGLAYSPGAFSGVSDNGSASLTFYSLATNSGVGRTLEFFNEAIDEVEGGKVDPEEVKLHKLRRARSDGLRAQSMSQMTGSLSTVIRADKGWDFATGRGELIADVKDADLKRLLEGCGEHTITTLEGPKDVLIPQLDEKGFEYEVVEWRAYGDDLLWQHDPKAAKKKEKDRQKAERKKAKDAQKSKKKDSGSDDESADAS
jgi:predicted Zn-dependent peptidase